MNPETLVPNPARFTTILLFAKLTFSYPIILTFNVLKLWKVVNNSQNKETLNFFCNVLLCASHRSVLSELKICLVWLRSPQSLCEVSKVKILIIRIISKSYCFRNKLFKDTFACMYNLQAVYRTMHMQPASSISDYNWLKVFAVFYDTEILCEDKFYPSQDVTNEGYAFGR